jgi:hypothetical protein
MGRLTGHDDSGDQHGVLENAHKKDRSLHLLRLAKPK